MRLILVLSLLILSGCTRSMEESKAAADKIVADYAARPRAPKQPSSDDPMIRELKMVQARCLGRAYGHEPYDYTVAPKCANGQMLAILKKYNAPNLDVWALKLNKQYALAEKVQKRQISKAEFEAKMSEVEVQTQNMLNARMEADYQRDRSYSQDAEAIVRANKPIECTSKTTYGVTNTTCR